MKKTINAKTLIFKDKNHSFFEMQFAHFPFTESGEWFAGNLPTILADTAQFDDIKGMNPGMDFSKVKLIDIEISWNEKD